MNIRDLIQQLEYLAEEHGDEIEVRLACQPSYPFEHGVGQVVAVQTGNASEMRDELMENWSELSDEERAEAEANIAAEEQEAETIAYIGEAGRVGYLPGAASRELGWR